MGDTVDLSFDSGYRSFEGYTVEGTVILLLQRPVGGPACRIRVREEPRYGINTIISSAKIVVATISP